jgi:arsenical pump membrane protein
VQPTAPPAPWTRGQWQGLALVILVFLAYPLVAYHGGSVWGVAGAGAVAAALLCRRHAGTSPVELVGRGIAWEILLFLFGVFMLAIGLRNAGIVGQLADLYRHSGVAVIGGVSALGSAIINNHSMALTNLLAIRGLPGANHGQFLAALIGGDLGPRLLPMGSLAGLLWFSLLRRLGVEVPLKRFVTVGAIVTLPALALSLALLEVTK